jgi:HEAT repeat protein
MTRVELSAFAVILCAYALWVAGMYAVAMVRSLSWRKRDQLSQELLPEIREALVDYLAGSDDLTKIRQFVKQSRRDVADALLGFQATVGGGARDRLCELALEQALVHDWCQDAHAKDVTRRRAAFERLSFVCAYEPCRRVAGETLSHALEDEDSEVRFSAAVAMLQSGGPGEIERVFELALTQNPLVRILLTEELRRYAGILCARAIPAVLASEDFHAVLATLEMLVAWERALPLNDLRCVLSHPHREIRLEALRLTPLVPLTVDTQSAILDALSDPDPEIAIAACHSAARLRIEAAMPGLARCLRCGAADLARAAAAALAEMPPLGWTTLLELGSSGNPVTAGAAREALERVSGKAGL